MVVGMTELKINAPKHSYTALTGLHSKLRFSVRLHNVRARTGYTSNEASHNIVLDFVFFFNSI